MPPMSHLYIPCQNPPECFPAPADPALAAGLDWMISSGPVSDPRCRKLSFASVLEHTVETVFLLGVLKTRVLYSLTISIQLSALERTFCHLWYNASMKKIRICFDISNLKIAVLTPTYTDKHKNANFYLTIALKFPSE